jgi:hypothetical protein
MILKVNFSKCSEFVCFVCLRFLPAARKKLYPSPAAVLALTLARTSTSPELWKAILLANLTELRYLWLIVANSIGLLYN